MSGSVDFFGRLFAGYDDNAAISGRAYLYNFDFLKFDDRAEELTRPVNQFYCQGICWRFKYDGEIKVYVNGALVITLQAEADPFYPAAFTLAIPLLIKPEDEVCVEVIDTEPRWFRWFRPNTAHVALEGLEAKP